MRSHSVGADRAWEVLQDLGPRGFGPAYANPHRAKSLFVSKVRRDPATGCWLWSGSLSRGRYPVFYLYAPGEGRKKRSAFTWMLETWFPAVQMPGNVKATSPTCGRHLCINPRHRRAYVPEHVYKLTPAQVLRIFGDKDRRNAREVAEEFGVEPCTVWRIWSGRQQSDVTGLKKPVKVYRKLTPEDVRAIYALRGSGVPRATPAEQYGVDVTTISHIWSGRTWSHVTGHNLSEAQTP